MSAVLYLMMLAADPAGWTTVREISASEAHQAAAADEQFLYAIANRVIAKYDRESGQRVAVSTGQAEHLNSGFFHQGKLYCAHSNYPKLPEQSEIKVLDPGTMQLTTFHDFGNYGGSLTWCLWKDGKWWCHFAKYGASNGESFLVEFDDQWNELRRFTWPKEVIGRIGRHSLSGAVWRGDSIMATGHDDPVLLRVKLPDEGTVLTFIETQPAPFTGQGIAVDPVNDGLVGIDRKRKKIILAKTPAR